ncbi:MAG: FecR domain-containing protein [Hyphomicrobium sp.]|nr:FecR domain-containing protein [Hyphomicrobium sp.]
MAAPRLLVTQMIATSALAALCMLPQGSARAGSGAEIGDARTIVSIVKADFDKEERELTIGDIVRQDEVIEVSDDGRGEFRLNDDTKLALGPGARMVLDKFVYDSDQKAGSIVLDLTKGAFRFITGVATKPTYLIRTPNASITVRGTIFDAYVLPDNSAWLLLHDGGIEVTSEKNVCHVLDRPGQLIQISREGTVSKPLNWKNMEGREAADFDVAFPFVANTPQIEPLPTTTRTGVIEAAFPDAEPKACANSGKPKTRKADDGDKPKKKKKRQASNDDYEPPRKTVKRKPKYEDDDDYGGGARAVDIIIRGGIGIGGGYRPGGGHTGGAPTGGGSSYGGQIR